MSRKIACGLSLAGLLMGSAAFAQSMEATATTDLNIRSGPGPTFEIVGVIPEGGAVTVEGCLDTSNWCQITHEGQEGWSFADYLTMEVNAAPLALSAPETRTVVGTVTYEEAGASTAAAGAAGAIAGALIGGPVGAALGAAAGLGVGALAAPDTRVETYVRENPVEPVYLEGEVVVGAAIPETVVLTAVPESEFRYVYVNGVPVIVEPAERRIVRIIR